MSKGKIIVIKLVTHEIVVGFYDEKKNIITSPAVFVMNRDKDGGTSIGLDPYLGTMADPFKTEIEINDNTTIATNHYPSESLQKAYRIQTSTLSIATPSEASALGKAAKDANLN